MLVIESVASKTKIPTVVFTFTFLCNDLYFGNGGGWLATAFCWAIICAPRFTGTMVMPFVKFGGV